MREGQLKSLAGVLAVIACGLVVAVTIIASSRHQLQGSSVLLNAQPAYYPSQILARRGKMQMLDEDEQREEDTNNEGEDEEGENAKLSDYVPAEMDPDDEYWPYNHVFRPTHSARFDEYGRLMRSGNCEINMFHEKYDKADYGFPQNSNCRHGPLGSNAKPAEAAKATKWGYKCFANGTCPICLRACSAMSGKCSLFPVDDDDVQYADQRASDGIARD